MSDLIAALIVFLKYANPAYPTHCEHDVLRVCVDPALVSDEGRAELERLGFIAHREGYFYSFRYGSH